jgi:prepilin signal peptidase PulO-like enzyme (type II secretory pathway)
MMVHMDTATLTALSLGILGLFFGSFAGATVWRLRASQLREDQAAGEKLTASEKHEVSKLKSKPLTKDRSVCLHCGHTLAWYDLVPLASWLFLKGKCRYCHKKIGATEPVLELAVGVAFAVSYFFWPTVIDTPLEIAQFVLWLVAIVGFAILTVYDLKWFLLPNKVVFPLIGLGAVYSLLILTEQNFHPAILIHIFGAVLVLSGFYYAIYVLSKEQWVGFGDVKLCLALALFLGNWQLGVLTLFLANVIGTLYVLPMMFRKQLDRQSRIPFGPLLIAGWFISGLFGHHILAWYMTFTLGV